jgi:hypothetical protein
MKMKLKINVHMRARKKPKREIGEGKMGGYSLNHLCSEVYVLK